MATISIPDTTYRRLVEKAAAAGTTVEQLVVPLLDQTARTEPPYPERGTAFETLMQLIHSQAGFYPPEHVLDISRDAMYEDRLRSQQ